jgi:hypothetical protein
MLQCKKVPSAPPQNLMLSTRQFLARQILNWLLPAKQISVSITHSPISPRCQHSLAPLQTRRIDGMTKMLQLASSLASERAEFCVRNAGELSDEDIES